jgi:2-polyprenyl-3-methyl-5-hydroxy-6-metoxy-1,4-benzoquinol methylase
MRALNEIHAIRRKLRNVHSLRSTFHFFKSLVDRVRWGRRSVVNNWIKNAYERNDPWNYTTCPEEADRFQSALNMLDVARKDANFERAFEVGCAEGVFTSMLAPRCKSLLAVDISQTALSRAVQRCGETRVKFEQWDLSSSPAPLDLDLVVVMDVLELFYRPSAIRDARRKLVDPLRPGGYLLLGNSRHNDIFETSWWGKWMLRGGKRIAEYFGEHPRLEVVATETRGIYVNALFRAKASGNGPYPS